MATINQYGVFHQPNSQNGPGGPPVYVPVNRWQVIQVPSAPPQPQPVASQSGPHYHFGPTQQVYNVHAGLCFFQFPSDALRLSPPEASRFCIACRYVAWRVSFCVDSTFISLATWLTRLVVLQGPQGGNGNLNMAPANPAQQAAYAYRAPLSYGGGNDTSAEYFVREYNGGWTIHQLSSILRDMQPGTWAHSSQGYPYFIRS